MQNQAVEFPGRGITCHLNLDVLGHVAPPLNYGVTDTAMTGQRRCSVISEESRRQPPKRCEIIIVSLVSGHLYRFKSKYRKFKGTQIMILMFLCKRICAHLIFTYL